MWISGLNWSSTRWAGQLPQAMPKTPLRQFVGLCCCPQLEGSTLLRRNGVIYRMCRCWGIGLVHAVFAYQHRLGTEAERLLPSTVLDMVNL